MSQLTWDQSGDRLFETGVDHGVLFIPDEAGAYTNGVAWNGLTTVTESPSGAEATPQYADNIKYLNLISAEEFGATIEAFTYPDEFAQFDGTAEPQPGVYVGQQRRPAFGFCYRSKLGNDLVGNDYGYKLHLVYNANAAPSEKAYATVNDSPEAISFSWDITTTPVSVGTIGGVEYAPTAIMTIDSTKVNSTNLASLETILYGAEGVDPALPMPADVIALFAGEVESVVPNAPTYVSGTHIATVVATTGVTYYNADTGDALDTGDQPALAAGESLRIEARPNAGYIITPGSDTYWVFNY